MSSDVTSVTITATGATITDPDNHFVSLSMSTGTTGIVTLPSDKYGYIALSLKNGIITSWLVKIYSLSPNFMLLQSYGPSASGACSPPSIGIISALGNCDFMSNSPSTGGSYQGYNRVVSGIWTFLVDPVPQFLSDSHITTALTAAQGTPYLADLTKGRFVGGVATDGVTQVVLQLPASSVGQEFTVAVTPTQCSSNNLSDSGCVDEYGLIFDPASPPSNIFSNTCGQGTCSKSITVKAVATADNGPMAFAAYRAPVDFVRSGTPSVSDQEAVQRSVSISVNNGAPINLSITLVRPPVVLVHGLWANANDLTVAGDLRSVGTRLVSNSRFTIFAANYGKEKVDIYNQQPTDVPSRVSGSNLGIAWAASFVLDRVNKFMDDMRTGNNVLTVPIAVVQADYVAHSMGSLVTRRLQYLPQFQSPYNFGKGYIHKVVSIGGPHLGSPVALNLLKPENSCLRRVLATMKDFYTIASYSTQTACCQSGAIADLAGNGYGQSLSPELQRLRQGGSLPVAYITGRMNDQEIAALSRYQEITKGPPSGNYVYTFNGKTFLRQSTAIDTLRFVCYVSGSPLLDMLDDVTFPTLMGGPSDGIVPLFSQGNGNGQANTVEVVSASNGIVHSGGAVTLGLGTIDTQPDCHSVPSGGTSCTAIETLLDDTAATAVIRLLNTSVVDHIYIRRQ